MSLSFCLNVTVYVNSFTGQRSLAHVTDLTQTQKDDQTGTRAYSNKLGPFKNSILPNRLNDVYRASYESWKYSIIKIQT